MATRTTISRIRHDSDATFREWIQEFETALAAIGLVQTADTGQINTATATRPGINTSGGYQIWRFADAAQATAPIFLKIEYRTGSVATAPAIAIGVGSGSNGSGTLTGGSNFTPDVLVNYNTGQATDTTRNSYWCHTAGMFAFHWKVGSGNTETCYVLARSVDNTGTPSGVGAIHMSTANSNVIRARYLTFGGGGAVSAQFTSVAALGLCHWPFSPSSSLVGSDFQVATAWFPSPRFVPVLGLVGVLNTEAGQGTTFSFTAVGTTAHTYLATSGTMTTMDAGGTLKPAFLWE